MNPSPRATLTKSQVIRARHRAAQGEPIRQIAADLDAVYPHLWNAVRGRTFAWLTEPPPVPSGERPKIYYTCQNPLCDARFPAGHGRTCPACTSYYHRNGRRRNPQNALLHGRQHKITQSEVHTLHARYSKGEPLETLVENKPYSVETLRRRFHELNLPTPQTPAGRHQKLTPSLVRQARHLAHRDNRPINEIAAELNINYMTIYSAIMGRTWRSAGGPFPDETAEQLTPCQRCGIRSRQPLCRFCRDET